MDVSIIMDDVIDVDVIVRAHVRTLAVVLVGALVVIRAVIHVDVLTDTHVIILRHVINSCINCRSFFVAPASKQLPPFYMVIPNSTTDTRNHILDPKLLV